MDDLLRALGRHQRDELDVPAAASEPDALDTAAQPFDASEREALLDAVFAQLDADAPEPAPASEPMPSEPMPATPSEPVATPTPAPVIDLAARRGALALVLSLAALLALVLGVASLLRRGRHESPQVAALPSYATSELRGGAALTRSDARPSELSMAASDSLDWIVTPAQAPTLALELGLLIEPLAAHDAARWITKVPATITESGVIRIRAPLAELAALEPGEHVLTLVIAEQGRLPTDRAAARTREDVQRVAIRITVTAP